MIKKGRSKELIKQRNLKLIARYYQLFEIKRMRYDDVIKQLSEEEFFITEQTIVGIILKEKNELERIRNNSNQAK